VTLLARSSRRYLEQHRSQVLLAVLGVTLGVAVVLAIDLAIQSARTGFRLSAEAVSGRATHQVTGGVSGVDEALVARLHRESGLRAVAPVVEGFATSPNLPGRALRVLGVDPFAERPFRPYVEAGGGRAELGAFMTSRGAVIVPAALAGDAGVAVGDSLPVLVGGQSWKLPVVGTVDPSDPLGRAGLSDVLLMDVAGAQEVLALAGELSRIDLVLGDDAVGRADADRVRASLPPGLKLEAVGTRAETMSGMIAAFDVNLTALSLLALVFGMFLIYNSVTFSVVQRRAILGRLRAMGVTRAEILRTILGEASVIGMAGAAFGIGLGTLLARGLVHLVTRTINDLYFAVSVDALQIEWILVLKAALLGLAATLLAALPPALEASNATPRLASLRSVVEATARRTVPRAAGLGAGATLAGGALLWLPSRSVLLGFAALFLIIAGMALITPAATLALVRAARPALSRAVGRTGGMAARGIENTLSRTAPAIAALVVAVSVTVGLGVMIQSFRGTLIQWLDGTLQADIYVSLPGPGAARATGTLWPELVQAYAAHPQVAGYSTYRGIDFVDDSDAYRIVALELDPRGERAFSFVGGGAAGIMRAFQAGEGVIVSEPFAFLRDLDVGDAVTIPTPAGPRPGTILGVFYDYGSEQGTIMMSRTLYDESFDDPGVTSMGLFLQEGASADAVVRDLLALVPEGRSVIARTNIALRSASLEVFDRTFRVTSVLRVLAFIVAFVGVLSALMALELERAREIGVLRATGLTPGQVWKLVVTQTGLMGVVAGVLAVPVGLVLSAVMIFVVNKRSFGWTLNMRVGPDVIGQALALALIAALLAGLYPAWRMSRTSPAEALRAE
jgi:putative ABC transport system permease protein